MHNTNINTKKYYNKNVSISIRELRERWEELKALNDKKKEFDLYVYFLNKKAYFSYDRIAQLLDSDKSFVQRVIKRVTSGIREAGENHE